VDPSRGGQLTPSLRPATLLHDRGRRIPRSTVPLFKRNEDCGTAKALLLGGPQPWPYQVRNSSRYDPFNPALSDAITREIDRDRAEIVDRLRPLDGKADFAFAGLLSGTPITVAVPNPPHGR